MKKRFSIIRNALQFLKKRWWYLLLLAVSSVYVYIYRFEITDITPLNAQSLIFILWLVLLALPLFSEIEIGSVKLKKEIEKTRSEMKDSIEEVKYQMLDLKVTSSSSNMLVFNNPPLPSKDELLELQKNTASNTIEHDEDRMGPDIPDSTIYLFKVRLSLEKKLAAICCLLQYNEGRTPYSMAQFLIKHEAIDYKTFELIREIINIANRGVHGEIIDKEYLQFVKKAYPAIKNKLDAVYDRFSNNSFYIVCPRCGYRGTSINDNACPKCGFLLDD